MARCNWKGCRRLKPFMILQKIQAAMMIGLCDCVNGFVACFQVVVRRCSSSCQSPNCSSVVRGRFGGVEVVIFLVTPN